MRMYAWHISVFYVGLAILQVHVQAARSVDFQQLGNGTVSFDTCRAEDFTNPEYEDYGPGSNLCFADKFPELTKDEKEKRNCCGFNGVVHTTTCDGTDDKNNKIKVSNVDVCQYPNQKNGKMIGKVKLKCPEDCKIKTLEELMTNEHFGDKGEFKIIDSKTIMVGEKKYPDGYCIAQKCRDMTEGWSTDAEVCDCNFEVTIEKNTKAFISNLKSSGEKNVQSCCGDRTPIELINHGNEIKDCGNNLVCKESETLVIESNENYSKVIDKMNQKVNMSDTESCVGVTLKGKYVYAKCRKPCQGKTPCLGRCCKLGESWNTTLGGCQKEELPADISDLFEENIKYQDISEKQKSGKGWKQIYSENTCIETKVSIRNGKLFHTNKSTEKETVYDQADFCYSEILGGQKQDGLKGRIFFLINNKDHLANETEETKSGMNGKDKELAYTVILAFSTILLFITIFIYVTHTALWKHYSKLMVNFAASLFVANILLLMIWKGGMQENCAPLGLALQFFFLATFAWMTIMSFEIFIQLKSSSLVNHGNDHKRIAKQACIGYGFPLFMIIVTGIVEVTAPICAAYRPRFEMKCGTFFGETDKFLWLYGPILVMLLLNTGMMMFIFYSVYKQKARKDGHGANRSQKADMICLYLRLFLGMGFIWYFEILSWAVNPKDDAWILTDFLNMMQGTYVFFIFVCKRNVLGVVFGKKSRLYSTVHQASIKLNRGKSVNMARQGSLTTDQSEISQSLVTDKVSVNINPAP